MPINTKLIIMKAMRELVISKDFNKITVEDITTSCSLTRGAFYYHFKSKFDLIEKIFIYDIGDISELSQDNIQIVLSVILDMIYIHKKYYSKIFKISEFKVFIEEYLENLISNYIFSHSTISNDEYSKLSFTVKMISLSITGILMQWSNSRFRDTPEVILENLSYFYSGIKSVPEFANVL